MNRTDVHDAQGVTGSSPLRPTQESQVSESFAVHADRRYSSTARHTARFADRDVFIAFFGWLDASASIGAFPAFTVGETACR
jgi:hypothetical protein